MIEVTQANYQAEVNEAGMPVFIDFYAPWCHPCQLVSPVIEEAAALLDNKVKFVKVNIDADMEIPRSFGIRGIPSYVLINRGATVAAGIVSTTSTAESLKQLIESKLQ